VASYGDLDLDVLQALQQDFDTASSGGEGAKRAKREQPHLMLSMNYTTAAQTINSLIEAERKWVATCLAHRAHALACCNLLRRRHVATPTAWHCQALHLGCPRCALSLAWPGLARSGIAPSGA
jgi:hypothetical protein